MRAHLAGHVGVADAGGRIGEAERAAGAGTAERLCTAERPCRRRLHETERELHALVLHALVVETARRWNGRRRQLSQRVGAQAKLAASGRKHTVGARDGASGADAAARRYFKVAGVDALLVVRELG